MGVRWRSWSFAERAVYWKRMEFRMRSYRLILVPIPHLSVVRVPFFTTVEKNRLYA